MQTREEMNGNFNNTLISKTVNPYTFKIGVFDFAWRLGLGVEYTLKSNKDLFMEFLWSRGENEEEKGSAAYFSNELYGVIVGIKI